MTDWIPLSTRLPKPYEKVAVLYKGIDILPDGFEDVIDDWITSIDVDTETGETVASWAKEINGTRTHWKAFDSFLLEYIEYLEWHDDEGNLRRWDDDLD